MSSQHEGTPVTATLFDKHRAVFERAQRACAERHCWSPFPEMPAKYSAVREFGGLTAFLYSEDEAFIEAAEAAYARAGAQLTINLTGPMPLNFAAAYSDYHVTGLNPAGNASLTDLSFVASRFRIVQSRRRAPAA